MTTQYTPILKLALPVTGELSGTWGDVVNDNITSMVEQAIAGLATINTWTLNSHTLTTANGTSSESRCAILVAASGAGLTAAGEIICPAATKAYVLRNTTAYTITLRPAAGTGVAVPAGETTLLFCDGTNVVSGVTFASSGRISGNLQVDGNLSVLGNTTLGDSSADTATVNATATITAKPTVQITSAATNTVTQALRIDSQSSGTPTAGIGVGMEFAAETAAGTTKVGATVEAVTTDVTAASEDFDLVVKLMIAGAAAAEVARFKSTGISLATGDTYQINNTTVLSATALGTGILGATQTWTAAQTFRAANAIRVEAAATQDAVVLAGRAGGTSSFAATITPTTLTANRTITLPDGDVTLPTGTVAVLGTAQTFTAAQTFRAANAVRSEAAATQDAVVLAGRAGGTSSFAATITPTTLTASRTVTLPDASTTVPVATQVLTFSGPTAARTITLPDANFTAARTDAAQTFTGTQTVRAAATQDSVALAGRAGGTSSFVTTLTPGTLAASNTLTLPTVTGTLATTANTSQTFAGATTFSEAFTLSGTTQNIALGTSQTTGTLTLGGTTQTGTITLGQSTGAQTVNIGTGATLAATTKAINIGTAGVAGSTTTIAIGSSTSTTTTTASGTWNYPDGQMRLGVPTPSAFDYAAFQIGDFGAIWNLFGDPYFSSNLYYSGGQLLFKTATAGGAAYVKVDSTQNGFSVFGAATAAVTGGVASIQRAFSAFNTGNTAIIFGDSADSGVTNIGFQSTFGAQLQTTSNTPILFYDTQYTLQNFTDGTKKAVFSASAITTATTRTYTLPDASGTFPLLGATQTFSGANTFSGAATFSSTFTLSGTTANISLGTSQTTGTLTVGGTAQTGAITVGQSTGAQTVNIGTGATTNATTKAINIGTAGVSGSITNVTVGSAVAGATGKTTINSEWTQVNAFAAEPPTTVNAATYTVLITAFTLIFTTTNCTVTLPAAASFAGRTLILKNVTANSVVSATSNVVPLAGGAAGTAILAATAGKFAYLQSDGTNWITMMAN